MPKGREVNMGIPELRKQFELPTQPRSHRRNRFGRQHRGEQLQKRHGAANLYTQLVQSRGRHALATAATGPAVRCPACLQDFDQPLRPLVVRNISRALLHVTALR